MGKEKVTNEINQLPPHTKASTNELKNKVGKMIHELEI